MEHCTVIFMRFFTDKHIFLRNLDAENTLDNFLVSAVSSFLIIRFYLELTGYPQIGGGDLHIAHMLWGGFLMCIAVVMLLSFLTKPSSHIAAVIGGVGFGAFIDELGKFITKDNDYFYQPTIALIYVIFIILYLSFNAIERNQKLTDKEYILNALEVIKESIINDMDREEKNHALELLNKSDPSNPVVVVFKKLIKDLDHVHESRISLYSKFKKQLALIYQKLLKRKAFIRLVVVFLILSSIVVLATSGISFFAAIYSWVSFGTLDISVFTFPEWGWLLFSTISSLLAIAGLIVLKKSRLQAYELFKKAVLVSIFLTQVFAFLDSQLSALIGLTINIIIFFTLQYMISQEEHLQQIADVQKI